MSSEVTRRVVEFWPVPKADELVSKLTRAPYFQRRTVLHVKMAAPRAPRFHYKFRELRRTEPRHADDSVFTARSISVLRALLVESLLWLSSPEDFNDPFDSWVWWTIEGTEDEKRARFEALANQYLEQLSPQERAEGLRRAMQMPHEGLIGALRESFIGQRRQFGVCCFAGDPRDVLMWSHYSGSHSGVCLQFETARDPLVFMRALRVDYVEQSPVINWMGDIQHALGESFLHKHVRWRYEGEHRILQREHARCCIRFAPGALTGIIFGCKADADVKREVGKLLYERRSLGLPPVKLYYSRQHEQRNEIQIWGSETGPAPRWTGRAPYASSGAAI
jgi:hypothetical protein